MAVVFVKDKVSPENIEVASEEYGRYIKITVDIQKEAMVIGGKWHVDGEKVLLEKGSRQEHTWGGGIDQKTKNIETIALINLRPKLGNNSQEILDPKRREKFVRIVKDKFEI